MKLPILLSVLKPFILLLVLTSCSTLFTSSRQKISIKNVVSDNIKLNTPDGIFYLDEGRNDIILTKSLSDIYTTVTCSNGDKHNAYINTRFNWVAGGAGNFLNGGLGWFIDPFTDRGYTIDDFDMMGFCRQPKSKLIK